MGRAVRFALAAGAAAMLAAAVGSDRPSAAARARSAGAAAPEGAEDALALQRVADSLEKAGPAGLRLAFEWLGARQAPLRGVAAAFLGLRRSREAVPELIRLLRDPDASVRRAAAAALGRIGDPRALPFLERDLATADLALGEAILNAARRIRATQPRREG